MHVVGIRELKNHLTYYLGLTKIGDKVVVTDRGKPMAVLHSLDVIEDSAGVEERIASLGKRGLIRLPMQKGGLPKIRPVKIKGIPVSKIILEERR